MRIEKATEVNEALLAAMARLIPQLSSSNPAPTRTQLQEMVNSPAITLLIARDDAGKIVGSLTLAMFRIPTAIRRVDRGCHRGRQPARQRSGRSADPPCASGRQGHRCNDGRPHISTIPPGPLTASISASALSVARPTCTGISWTELVRALFSRDQHCHDPRVGSGEGQPTPAHRRRESSSLWLGLFCQPLSTSSLMFRMNRAAGPETWNKFSPTGTRVGSFASMISCVCGSVWLK